jgi:hypothetical protein
MRGGVFDGATPPPLERLDWQSARTDLIPGAYKVAERLAGRCNVENVRKQGCFRLNFPLSGGLEMPMI